WNLSCKFDDLTSIQTLFSKLNQPGQNNLPALIEAVGKYRCPRMIKHILTIQYEGFKKELLQGKFGVLIHRYKSHDLLDAVIEYKTYYPQKESTAVEIFRALLDAGVEGVDQSIDKWRDKSEWTFVLIMQEHLKKPQAAGKE
ncbi:MAG: hypothetical protein ABSA17_02855, partial [Rhabdochlamydiaceae bacterium]